MGETEQVKWQDLDVKLNARQSRAIACLMTSQSDKEAAQMAGISYRTLHRWLAQDNFRAALAGALNSIMESVIKRLIAGQNDALNTLHELLKGAESESVRRTAATDWMSIALKFLEMRQFEERLTALEEEIHHGK